MLGTQLLHVADVCSESQVDGENVCDGGLISTSVRTLRYLCLHDTLLAWGLRGLGHECVLANPCDSASDDIKEEWSAT
jgi:hypothetical protein